MKKPLGWHVWKVLGKLGWYFSSIGNGLESLSWKVYHRTYTHKVRKRLLDKRSDSV